MTSTPTACPDCNNCGLPCLNEIHHPRQPSVGVDSGERYRMSADGRLVPESQPDNEMNELLMETIVRGQNKPDIYERVNRMQLAQEEIERAARGEPDTSARCHICKLLLSGPGLITCSARHGDTSARDAAAEVAWAKREHLKYDPLPLDVLAKNEFLVGYTQGHARALKEMGAEVTRLSGHVRDLVGDVKNLTAVLNLTTDDRTKLREQLAAAQGERDQQQEWAMKFQRERDAAELRADAYEQTLVRIANYRPPALKGYGPNVAENAVTLASHVLAAHKSPTKEAADE